MLNEKLILQSPELKPTPQHVLNTNLRQIDKAQEEQCLEFTLLTEDAPLILELLYADADFERRGT